MQQRCRRRRDGVYYSKAAALDAYEVPRQLIDATDELEGLFVAVLLQPELVTNDARGLPAYTALHPRVADEVRDRRRPSPYAGGEARGGRSIEPRHPAELMIST